MSPKNTQDSSNTFKQKKKGSVSLAGKFSLIFILVLVVLAFVVAPLFSGIGNNGSGQLVFGSYGDNNIEYSQGSYFYNQVNMLNNMYRDQISQSEDLFDFYRYYIWSSAYQQSVIYAAKSWELEKSGFTLSDKGLSRLIIQSGYYNNEEGVFDETNYATATTTQRDEIKDSVEATAYLNQYNSDRLGGLYKSQAQIDSLIGTNSEERKFQYVFISAEDYPDSEVIAYGESNEALFTSYPLSRLTLATAEDAEKVIGELNDGSKTFAEAAAAYSSDMYAATGGEMGDVYRYTLIDELGEESTEAVLSLSEGSYSAEAIETDYGWYIYSMNGTGETPDFSDSTLLEAVKNWMTWNEATLIDEWIQDEAEALIASVDRADANSFTYSAARMDYTVADTDFFPLNWGSSPLVGGGLGSSQDVILQNASTSDDFFTAAFSLENTGDLSQPVILENGSLILKLVETRESESKVDDYTCRSYLQQTQDELYSTGIFQSELYEDNFSDTYYRVFPSENTEQS
ncbi:MAG: peptidylprolyl isomerase [Spirochaetales bacterium]|nr:peptidylprolyl isomerase [Spirochaetales bacterium]